MAIDAARAKSLFLYASDLADPAERAAYLERECAGDAELRGRVEALLRANDAVPLPPAEGEGATVDSRPEPDRPEHTGEYTPQPNEAPSPLVATTAYHPHIEPGLVIACRYTLVQKIGEGGMGEVWVARQTEPVKRNVALKLIKTGMESKAVVARFEQERQALAMMDHPNIARVLDGGMTPTGQPFFVMELVNGLPLTRFCDEMQLTPRERLELFVPICQAVQHAHQKGIVHRDLKPANILIATIDARPVPKVIDFGVAKATAGKLTDESMSTQFGAIVGTLEYMSPEQAGFLGEDVDTRADIYALGVILYELLTGLRPLDARRLRKAALTEMIRIIREEEPSKPSTRLSTDESLPSLAAMRQTEPKKLMALLRGELDWVVMKCLEKQRERRYETANGLARDIQRYLADEVVEARPPSAGYRLKKFIKRHKGQVLAASLILLVLLAGMAGTTLGLLEARRQEEEARMQEREAKRQEGLAKTEAAEKETQRAKAVEARNDLAKSNDELLSSVARSLLRPLAVQVQSNQPLPPLNEQEIEPLWDLASSKDDRLRLRFVEVGLRDPLSTRRMKDRSPFVFQAAVGLDKTRRTQVEELLGQRLQSREIAPQQQEHVALCLAHLGVRDQRLSGRTAATLTQAMSKGPNPNTLRDLAQSLSAVAARLEPKEAVPTLIQAMSKTSDWSIFQELARGLSAVAGRLEPKEAAATLIQAMSKIDPYALPPLARALSAVAARMPPKEAARVGGAAAATLTQTMSRTTFAWHLEGLAQSISVVAVHMEPKAAADVCGQAADTLGRAMLRTTAPNTLQVLAQGLSAVAARMEPIEAAKVCAPAAVPLIQAVSMTTDLNTMKVLSDGLSAVAAHINPKDAADALTQALIKLNPNVLKVVSESLSAAAARMNPIEAEAADATLTQAMSKTTSAFHLEALARGLSAVAARMEPKQAAVACGKAAVSLTHAMSQTTDANALRFLARGLSAVAARMEPKQAAATLIQAMSKSEGYALQELAPGLSAVAARMNPKDAAAAAAALTQSMSKNTNPYSLQVLAQGLSEVTARMEPVAAAEVCGQAAATFTQLMNNRPNWLNSWHLQALAQGLSAVAANMEPKAAAEVCGQAAAVLTQQTLSNATNSYALGALGQGLSAVAARMNPKDTASTAAVLGQTVLKTADPHALNALGQGLSAMVARMNPKETAALTRTLSKNALAQGLSGMASHMDPKEAAVAAASLTQTMSKTTAPDYLLFLSQSLSAMAARMEPKEAAKVCGEAASTLTQVMSKMTDPQLLRMLAQALPALAARLESKDAAEVAIFLSQTMSAATGMFTLDPLSQGLSAATARLDPKDAADVAAALIQALSKTTNSNAVRSLAQGLSAVLSRETSPLPVQTLVDLLKHPFCVGEPRRLLLEQLGRHYHRPFADQWEFVDHVLQQKLDLELITPPQRPRLPAEKQ